MLHAHTRRSAAALLAVLLVALIALCALPGGIIRVTASAASATFACQPVPVPSQASSASPSASPSPASLCVSVLPAQGTAAPGSAVNWSIAVWVQGASGMTDPVAVTLTTDSSAGAWFTGSCPSGNQAPQCTVGTLGTGGVPTVVQLQAQLQIPASATGSLTLFATATAYTTPPMPLYPQAAQAITIASPSPSATASPSPSATPSPSASATPSPAASHTPSAASHPAPGSSAAATTPGVGVGTVLPAPIQPLPVLSGPASTTGGGSSSSQAPGTIASMLPVLTPGSYVPPSTSPAANVQAIPAASGSVADSGRFILTIAMPGDTARAVALVALAVVAVIAITLIARSRRSAARAGRTATNEVGITRWLWLMMRKRSRTGSHRPDKATVPPEGVPD